VDTVTVSGNTYAVLWRSAPSGTNHVYGIGLHTTNGKVVQVEYNNGVYSIQELDRLSTDTQNTAGSSPSSSKLFLVGAGSQSNIGEGVATFSNANVYEESGNLYASYSGSQTGGNKVATEGWVKDRGYTTNVGNITNITMNGHSKGTSGNVNLGDVVTGGTTKYAHPSFTGTADLSTAGSTATTSVASENHTHGITLTSNGSTSSGAIKYLESVSNATGTTKYAGAVFTGTSATSGEPSDTITVASDSHTHGITVNLKSADSVAGLASATSAANKQYLEDITITSKKMTASFSGTSKKSDNTNETKVTPASSSHTHTATSSGTVTLSASTVSTDGPKYIEEVIYTAPTVTPSTVATGGHIHGFTPSGTVSLGSNTTADGGVKYAEDHTAASLGTASTGTVTLATGSGKLEAYDAATGGTKKVSNGTRIPVITALTSGGATGTGGGTAAPNEHTHNVTVSGTTGNDSGSGTSVATAAHTHAVTLTANDSTADGRITYLQTITTGSGNLTSVAAADAATGDIAYLSGFTAASLGSPSTSSAAPGGHKHTITMSGSTGNNNGTKVDAVTAINAGSGDLTTNSTSDGGIYYLNSHTAASLTAQSKASVGISGGSGSLEAYDASTSGTKKVSNGTRVPFVTSFSAGTTPPSSASFSGTAVTSGNDSGNGTGVASTAHRHSYTTYSLSGSNASGSVKYAKFSAGTTPKKSASFSGTAATITPTLTGTTTFVTGYGSFAGGSGNLESYDAATNGTKKSTDGARIPYVAAQGTITGASYTPAGSVTLTNGTAPSLGAATTKYLSASFSGTAATITPSLTGTTTFVTGYPSFSGGSLGGTTTFLTAAIKSAMAVGTRTTSGSNANARRKLTITTSTTAADSTGTVTLTKASLGTASTGTVGISGASYTPAGSVTLTANDATATGRITYVQAQGTFSAGTTPKASASFSGTAATITPTISNPTIYYLAHSHTGATLGSPTTKSVGISGASYTPAGSITLTDGTAPSMD